MILAGVGSAGACDSAGETAIKDALQYFPSVSCEEVGVGALWKCRGRICMACFCSWSAHSSPL